VEGELIITTRAWDKDRLKVIIIIIILKVMMMMTMLKNTNCLINALEWLTGQSRAVNP